MARHAQVYQTFVSRVWRAFGLKPHLVDTWKLSTDPQFVEKVRDVVGLYLDLPGAALTGASGAGLLTANDQSVDNPRAGPRDVPGNLECVR